VGLCAWISLTGLKSLCSNFRIDYALIWANKQNAARVSAEEKLALYLINVQLFKQQLLIFRKKTK